MPLSTLKLLAEAQVPRFKKKKKKNLGKRDKDQKLARFFFVVTMVTSRGTKNDCALKTSNTNTKKYK